MELRAWPVVIFFSVHDARLFIGTANLLRAGGAIDLGRSILKRGLGQATDALVRWAASGLV